MEKYIQWLIDQQLVELKEYSLPSRDINGGISQFCNIRSKLYKRDPLFAVISSPNQFLKYSYIDQQ